MTGFTVINASGDIEAGELEQGGVVDIQAIGSHWLTIRATVEGVSTDVQWTIVNRTTGEDRSHTDRDEPYSLRGDGMRRGRVNYRGSVAMIHNGDMLVEAVPYDGDHMGTGLAIGFTIIGSENAYGGSPGDSSGAASSPATESTAGGPAARDPVITNREGSPITDGITVNAEGGGTFDLPQGWLEDEADRLCDLGGSGYSIGMSINVECP